MNKYMIYIACFNVLLLSYKTVTLSCTCCMGCHGNMTSDMAAMVWADLKILPQLREYSARYDHR